MNNENIIKEFTLELDKEVQIVNNQGKIREFSSKEEMDNTIGKKGEYVSLMSDSNLKEIYKYENGQWNLMATNTMGATITSEDIVADRYGFANGEKVEGKINKVADTVFELETPIMTNEEETESIVCKTEPINNYFANTNLTTRIHYNDLAPLINLTSDKIIEGEKVLNIEGAAESEVAEFAKGIVERGKITMIPEGITKVGTYAFSECTGLVATELPKGITSIANYGFIRCSQLALTELPEGLETIGQWAFKGCTKLALTKLPESLTKIGFESFADCINLTITKIPQKITTIDGYIFSGCTGITELTCEGAIKTIDSYGLYKCSNLIKFAMPNITAVPTLKNINAFQKTPIEEGIGYIYVPDNLVESFKVATNWSTYANQIKSINEMEE